MVRPVLHPYRFRPGIRLVAWAVLIFATSSVTALAKGPHPKRNDQYKHEVEQLEEAWRIAQLNGDVEAMDRLLSDDYVGITMTGQVVTKTQQLDRMRNRTLVLTKIVLDDPKVKLIGTTAAVVTSLAEVEGTSEGTPMHGKFRYTRVYSRLPSGTWKITNFEVTRVGTGPPHDHRGPKSQNPGPD
jgi:ketosteroid isomerase-like protein